MWKKESCAGTSSTSASASPSGVEVPSDREGLATGAGSGGLFDIESGGLLVVFQRAGQYLEELHTPFCSSRRRWFVHECSLFEWPPLEILLVSPANDAPLVALLARWFCLVAF